MTIDILTAVAVIVLALGVYWNILSYRRHKTNLAISGELEKIIENAGETIKKTKKTIQEQRASIDGTTAATSQDLLETPELMSTLIAVMVHKYGDVRLGMNDFMISDEDYVSVYVDSESQEIILSMDNNLDDVGSYLGFRNPDDKTFH